MQPSSRPAGVLAKSAKILACFRQKPGGLALGEICEVTRINKSSAHRLLSQMAAGGLIERSDDGRYVIGRALFQLGLLAPKPQELRSVAHPLLNDLARETGETVSLSILDGPDIILLDVIESLHEFRMVARIGSVKPFHLTSLGKVTAAFLSDAKLGQLFRSLRLPLEAPTPHSVSDLARLRDDLSQIRRRGYALSDQEYVLGVRAAAAAVFSAHGEAEAAVGISGPVSRLSMERLSAMAGSVVSAADKVTELLGGAPHSIKSLLD
ncbi:MAG: IclR family transcriptional regulator [Terriglobia bacterium]